MKCGDFTKEKNMGRRIRLFESFGFECVGAEVEGFFTKDTHTDYEAFIWIDWYNRRVMIDCGNSSEPVLLKGNFTNSELEQIKNLDNDIEKEITDANNYSI